VYGVIRAPFLFICRGHCYEYKSCSFHKTDQYKRQLKAYREGINQ